MQSRLLPSQNLYSWQYCCNPERFASVGLKLVIEPGVGLLFRQYARLKVIVQVGNSGYISAIEIVEMLLSVRVFG